MRKIFILICLFLAVRSAAQDLKTSLQEDLSLKYLVQSPTEKSKKVPVVILLHGYGSDERDLFELRNFFPKSYLIISARAPYSLSSGGYQWYEGTTIKGQRDGNKEQLTNSRNLIDKFIPQIIKKYKADPKNVYLVGFSQGAIMSYEEGLSNPSAVKGIGVLSGMIFNSLKPLIKNTPALQQLKIFVSHGTNDQRIPFAEAKTAVEYLKGLNLKPQFHQYDGMGHQINKEVLGDLLTWLK